MSVFQSKKIMAAIVLSALICQLFVLGSGLPQAKAQFGLGEFGLIGGSGCENATGGGSGDFVPVCEVNPRIITPQSPLSVSFFGMLLEQVLGFSGPASVGGVFDFVTAFVQPESILANTQKKNVFDSMELGIFRVVLSIFKTFILNLMADQITQWITGEGVDPQFIQNWESYLSGAYDIGFLSAARELAAADVCPQFKNQVMIGVTGSLEPPGLPLDEQSPFIGELGCTLNSFLENQGVSYEDYQDDFRNGGWLAYSKQIYEPQNTYYGALSKVLDEADRRAASKANAAEQQGLASNGYFPIKRCALPFGAPPEECLEFETTSPASVLESALDGITKSRIDYIVNADQLLDIGLIIAEAFLNRLIGAGIDGLLGYGAESADPGGGYVPASQAEAGLRWACYDPATGNATGPSVGASGLGSCNASCGRDCGLCAPAGGVNCGG